MRETPKALLEHFERTRSRQSDINEHLDLLRDYALRCEHVTEFGMRGADGSTVAFLAAQPAKLISWDINPLSVVSQSVLDLFGYLVVPDNRTTWEPRVGNTLEIVTEPTDLLFIDTLHTAKQLLAELVRHVDPLQDRVRKYLVFHDTTTFGYRDEVGEGPGLRLAIRKFQKEHAFPLWQLVEDRPNNNGLVVLERVRPR